MARRRNKSVPRARSTKRTKQTRAPKMKRGQKALPITASRNGSTNGSLVPSLSEQIAPKGRFEPLAESVRYILARPQIDATRLDTDLPRVIAVVAALPGEGVSTVSSVFSSVLSNDAGLPTCRVDLSWASASAPKVGVLEVIAGAVDIDDALEWNGMTATLHSGPVTPSERHRLARSQELADLVEQLGDRFEHVVLDLPAILSGSDGLTMMRLADAYLLVVKHGVTTLQQVQMATDQLADFESLGSVLNQVQTHTPWPLNRWLAG